MKKYPALDVERLSDKSEFVGMFHRRGAHRASVKESVSLRTANGSPYVVIFKFNITDKLLFIIHLSERISLFVCFCDVFTSHSTNPVPVITVGSDYALKEGGKLCDLCPTLLDIMGIAQPKEMTGESLLIK